jgi:6-pyruvoyltetrahydropterin/6-carboxytetrahydropterin synthase
VPDPDSGFIIDVKKSARSLRNMCMDKVDHKNLNMDVPFMSGQLASTENL